jgi:hypothetical protein
MKKMESDQYIHPECNLPFMRGRGIMWWTESQHDLNQRAEKGDIVLTIGTCYKFLEEELERANKPVLICKYGNVYMGDHWIMRRVAFPKYHLDGNAAPYHME